jgi:hypothetical protein
MMGAIQKRCLEIDDGATGQDALSGRLSNAFFNCRNPVLRHCEVQRFICELLTSSARQRLQANPDLRKLSRAADPPLVNVDNLDGARDGFSISALTHGSYLFAQPNLRQRSLSPVKL